MTNLKLIRQKHNLTQKEVAKKLNVGIATYQNYESGKYEPNLQTLKNMSKLFNVSIDYLCDNKGLHYRTPEQEKACNIICMLEDTYLNLSIKYLEKLLDDQRKINELKIRHSSKWTT